MTKLDDILTTAQVARMHRCSARSVRLAIEHGLLAATRIHGIYVVLRRDAEKWERRKAGRPRKVEP